MTAATPPDSVPADSESARPLDRLMRVYGPEAGAAWLRVRRHLELGQGFAFIPVFVSEPFAAQLAREDLLGFLHGRREQLVEVPVDSPAALAGLSATLAGLTLPPSAGAIWVAAVPSAEGAKLDEWKGAWTRALARLNERRDVFRSRFDVPLLLVGPVWLQELCLRQAPDLWSVRTLVISLEPAATKDGDGFDAQLAAEAAMTSRHGTWHRQTLDPDYFEVHVVQPLRRKGPPEELVDSLLDLMQAQRGRGRRGEASATAEEAVGVARENAVSGSENARGQLAAALNAWSVAQSELGRRAEALALAQEAVELYRALARQNPDAFQPDLAGSLNNLAGFLSELGRRAEALAPAQEAVELYRALARQNPDAFQPALASSLNNLANRLSELGRRAEALAPAQEAVEIRRALARQNPDAFQPALAMSLNNLAIWLSALGRRAEALAPAQEAVELYRALARQNPDAFQPDLAMSLWTLSQVLAGLERHAEAALALAEALRTLQPQFTRLPEAFAQLMGALVRGYVEATRAASTEPDSALLGPILEILERFQQEKQQSSGSTGCPGSIH